MNMRINQTGRGKFSLRVDNFFSVVLADTRNFSVRNGNISALNFSAENVHDATIFYNEVGKFTPRRNFNQIFQFGLCHKNFSFAKKNRPKNFLGQKIFNYNSAYFKMNKIVKMYINGVTFEPSPFRTCKTV